MLLKYLKRSLVFGLGLACQAMAIVSYQKSTPAKTIYEKKKRVKMRSTAYHYASKRSVKITIPLGLDNIIKFKCTTNFDRCAISNVLNSFD